MQFNKPPKCGARFQFPENAELSTDGLKFTISEKIACAFVDEYDEFIAEEIAREARAAGISDCTVLNKKAILEAIEKQIPKKPVDLKQCGLYGRCAVCGNVVHVGNRYCDQCGQALDWECEDEEVETPF
jgi:hypothetical protein